jgi:mannose-6-phosphate isomerase
MDIYKQPWRLLPNPIWAFGGRETSRFRKVYPAEDIPNGSEEWIASDTNVNGSQTPYFGHSKAVLPDGRTMYLSQAISMDPENALGENHLQKYGRRLGVLLKLLDAKEQYLLQCHPNRQVAKTLWKSDFGKEESWYILSVREDPEEAPYILLGFKEGITEEAFSKHYKAGNLQALEQLCHKIPVQAGDAYYVPAGVPHALGKGCFAAEIQEPSDVTAVPIAQEDLIAFRQRALPGGIFHKEDNDLYDQKTLKSFDYSGYSMKEILDQTKSTNKVLRKTGDFIETLLIGQEHTKSFIWKKADIDGTMEIQNGESICIAVILSGSGKIISIGGELEIHQGDVVFFPYPTRNSIIKGGMSAILCNPG